MEAHARAPDPLTKDGDIARNWQSWKEDFIIFMKVTGYIDKPNEIRANLLKNRIGKVGIDAIQTMSFDNPQDKEDMDILIKKLEEYFNPPKKEVVERYTFFTRVKKQNESIEQYINILKDKAKTCNFNDMTDSIIRDKIILETHDKILRKKFFEADNLDLQKLVMIYNDYNINTEKMKQITKENKMESENSTPTPSKQVVNNIKKGGCWRCSTVHPHGKCPAWGSKCTKCGDTNHFTHCCKGFKNNPKADDKVNKNLLDAMAKPKPISKNDNKWNNQADSGAKTMDSINKMTSLPDIPKTSCYAANSSFDSNITSDLRNAPNTSSNLRHYNRHNNTTNPSAFSSSNTQYNYSDVKEASARMVTDSSNKCEKIHPTTIRASTPHTSNNTFQNTSRNKNASQFQYTQTYKHHQKKNLDEDNCILS